ncbi:hypothetical protein AF349_19765 [Salmonella enterica subsp. enterica serovar Typhimurium]|nr:hypothetical protein AF349_19765 [Salmonella enterica subsp. enterica serovar Typhimurium]
MHRAQGKPQPDAHGRRELKGETVKPERSNDRKIAADVKEGPGDRRVHFTLVSTTARLRWMHGTARTRHRTVRVENHKATAGRPEPGECGAEKATSFCLFCLSSPASSQSPAEKLKKEKETSPSLFFLVTVYSLSFTAHSLFNGCCL